jgi:microcystin-dependent protein
MDSFVGAIFSFGFNFAPYGWAQCNGQLLPIASNEALFSLIGTIYGGDGQTTFGLPNLQGRTPIGTGQGPGTAHVYDRRERRQRNSDTSYF